MTEEEIRKIEKLTEAVRALDNTLSGIAWLKLTEMTEGSLEKVKKSGMTYKSVVIYGLTSQSVLRKM